MMIEAVSVKFSGLNAMGQNRMQREVRPDQASFG